MAESTYSQLIMVKGAEVLGEKFQEWLSTPNAVFAGLCPRDVLEKEDLREAVYDELIRIEHGIFV